MSHLSIGAILAAVILAVLAGAWFKGREYERDRQLSAQLQAEVRVTSRQRAETVKEVIRYVDRTRYVERALPAVQRDIVSRCLGLLPDGAPLRAGGAGSAVPADGAGDLAAARARGSAADQAWCGQLAADYARGARNTERVRLARGWIRANGGAPEGATP